MLLDIHSILNLFFRLQEEYEKSKEGETIRYSSDGEDLFEKIKYHQELVDLERKVNLKMIINHLCSISNWNHDYVTSKKGLKEFLFLVFDYKGDKSA